MKSRLCDASRELFKVALFSSKVDPLPPFLLTWARGVKAAASLAAATGVNEET